MLATSFTDRQSKDKKDQIIIIILDAVTHQAGRQARNHAHQFLCPYNRHGIIKSKHTMALSYTHTQWDNVTPDVSVTYSYCSIWSSLAISCTARFKHSLLNTGLELSASGGSCVHQAYTHTHTVRQWAVYTTTSGGITTHMLTASNITCISFIGKYSGDSQAWLCQTRLTL